METKNSIEKMLKAFNAKTTEMNLIIIEVLLDNLVINGVYGMPKSSLANLVFKNVKEYSRAKFNGALKSLNNHEVVSWTVVKGITRVNLTANAWAQYFGRDIKEGAKELVGEVGNNLDECYHTLSREGGKLKKKALKKIAKGLEEVAKKLRGEKTKK